MQALRVLLSAGPRQIDEASFGRYIVALSVAWAVFGAALACGVEILLPFLPAPR